METNKEDWIFAFITLAAFIIGFVFAAWQSAHAATSFSTPAPFKQGGTGNTQIIPVYPTWSIGIPLPPPTNFAAASTTGGSLSSTRKFWFEVAASNGTGTTTASSELATTTSISEDVHLTWTPVPGATSYGVYFSTTTAGAENAYFNATTTNQYDFTSTSTPIFGTIPGFPSSFAVQISNATNTVIANGLNVSPIATTTSAIGGSLLASGSCTTSTSTIPYGTISSSTVIDTTPKTYPGSGITWESYALNTTQIVTEVCALLSTTPVSTAYNVRAY